MLLDIASHRLVGEHGSLLVVPDDEITIKLAMLIEGECEGLGPLKAAEKYGFCKQRYFQLRELFLKEGAQALKSKPRGPKKNYRRTDEIVRQVVAELSNRLNQMKDSIDRLTALINQLLDLSRLETYSELTKSAENIREKIAIISDEYIMKVVAKYRVCPMGNT